MLKIAMFDTHPYDRDHVGKAAEDKGFEVKYYDLRLGPDSAELVRGTDAVCVFVNDKLPKEVLETLAGAGVKIIALRCAGFNNVDLGAAKDLGLKVVRVPAYSPYAVAEHAVGLLMALNRKLPKAWRRVRELNFSLDGLVGFDLHGRTAGIVGTGKIGKITAEIFQGFGMNVIAFDVYQDNAWAESRGIPYKSLDEVLAESDIISLHTPLTPETRHLINAESLEKCKDGVGIINVSRGALIDTKALIHALKTGKVGGVGLDVYEEEEGVFFEDLSWEGLQDDTLARLLTFPNVLITAHQAFLTVEALNEIARVTTENLERFDKGEPFLEGTELTAQ